MFTLSFFQKEPKIKEPKIDNTDFCVLFIKYLSKISCIKKSLKIILKAIKVDMNYFLAIINS